MRARSYGVQPLIDRMKHAPACTTGQILLLIYYTAGNFVDQLIPTKKTRHKIFRSFSMFQKPFY